jgi:molecular chaperone DnaJ
MECQSCGGSGISVSPDSICGSCKGDGRVKEKREIQIDIPPGVDTGERLRVTGRGNASREANGISGDLFVHINVASPSLQESRFKRQGADISVETNIPFYQAILGGPAQVPTLDGYVTLKVQPGMQSDTRIVMPGYGIQKLSQPPGVKGNQTVIFKVLTPSVKELTEEQRKLLEEFRRISEQNENRKAGESKGFLRKTLYRLKDSLNCDDNIDKKPDQGGR